MEASSTTMNITGPAAPDPETKRPIRHSHGANFGKFIAGCPRCLWNRENPDRESPSHKKRRKESVRPQVEAAVSAVTKEQILAILRENAPKVLTNAAAETQENTLQQLVKLMLARESRTLKKEEDTEARRLQMREEMVKVARENIANLERHQAACNHTKENGRSSVAQSQIHNDGYIHPFCMRCQKTFPKRRPYRDEQSTSVEA